MPLKAVDVIEPPALTVNSSLYCVFSTTPLKVNALIELKFDGSILKVFADGAGSVVELLEDELDVPPCEELDVLLVEVVVDVWTSDELVLWLGELVLLLPPQLVMREEHKTTLASRSFFFINLPRYCYHIMILRHNNYIT